MLGDSGLMMLFDIYLADRTPAPTGAVWRGGSVKQGEADCCHINVEPGPKAILELLQAL